MPLYPFACEKCDHQFEALIVRATSEAKADCPACGSDRTERLLGVPSAVTQLSTTPATNCRGDGPPCGASWCGRK